MRVRVLGTFLALVAAGLGFSLQPLAAQTVTTTFLTRADTLASGGALFGYPATFDSSRVRMYWCLETATAGVVSKWKCTYRTDTAWLPRVTPPPPPATLTAVVVTPANASVLTGDSQQFSATGQYSDNTSATLAVGWSATGGTVTSGGLYTAGGTPGTFRVIGLHAGSGKADTSAVIVTAPVPTLMAVELSPTSASLLTGSAQQFTALGRYTDNSTTSIPIAWLATGGTITSAGLYTAGTTAGSFQAVATNAASGLADTAAITIGVPTPPPPGGPYIALYSKDWNSYPDKAALAGVIGVEGGLQTAPPALPVTAFYDLVADPIFGKVVRYLGDTTLNINTTSTTRPGRTATHSIGLGKKSQINASWWTPTCLMSPTACNVDWFPTDVWVHQFLRFSTTWTSTSATCGQGAADYKTIFLRYWSSAARDELKFGTNGRGIIVSKGLPGLTMISEGALSNQNAVPMSVQYPGSSGWPGYDGWPLTSAPGPFPSAPYGSGTNYGPGNGQWVEVAIHHKSVGERLEFSVYWRQYTVAGSVNPQAWKIDGHYTQVTTGQVWRGLSNYVMGVNRNRCYDAVMAIDWGPYEVVDGSTYANPWGLVLP